MNKTVLIIDDNPDDFKMLSDWANEMGFDVLPQNHEEESKAINERRIEDYVIRQISNHSNSLKLILCDIKLNNDYLAGNKILKRIRNYTVKNNPKWTSNVPFYGITQHEDLLADIVKDGATDVIHKDDIRKRGKGREKTIRNRILESVDKFELYLKRVNSKQIFIVHGHDKIKYEVARVIEHLKLKPIILDQEIDFGQTIIEKFEAKSIDAGFAIILLTGDDLGNEKAKAKDTLNPRARQNVIFEMGYFMAMLSRHNVFLLYEEGVELPSDTKTIGYTSLNDEWKLKLVKALQACGYNVNASSL